MNLEPDRRKAQRGKLSYWFWGTIIIFAIITLLLNGMAALRHADDATDGSDITAGTDDLATDSELEPQPPEASAEEMLNALTAGERAALSVVLNRLQPELDLAFEQAYAAIPAFADFHYSLVGEYTELAHAALGGPVAKLQELVFTDIDSKLLVVEANLNQLFVEKFSETVTEALIETESAVGRFTRIAVNDALERVKLTLPTTAVTLLGSKAAAAMVAKKISVKLAAKAAAKAGGKWAAASASAGTGALLCSWSGPGAAVCAIGGGAVAWIGTDYVMVKLDEAWSRDEFETDLELMLDDQKRAYAEAISKFYATRVVELHKHFAVTAQDFTLRDLSGGASAEVCKIAQDLITQYNPLKNDLIARTPAAINGLRVASQVHSGSLALGPTVQEIVENLDKANNVILSLRSVEGNVPLDFRADRDLSGNLYFGEDFELVSAGAPEEGNTRWTLTGDVDVSLNRNTTYSVALEQHLRIRGNRFFGGAKSVVIMNAIGNIPGLTYRLRLPLPLTHDENATELENTAKNAATGQHLIVDLSVNGEMLADIALPTRCRA